VNLLADHPHRRRNPLTGDWVLVSPRRTERPWQGQVEPASTREAVRYDPECYLCPGNLRAGGVRNPHYESTFVFDNDFAALCPDTPPGWVDEGGLLLAAAERGVCRVLCFSPDHSLAVPSMTTSALCSVVEAWTEQYRDLGALPGIRSVQIFENRGELMGASNPHPHCQVWASESVPNELDKEVAAQRAHHRESRSCLLCDYLRLERDAGARLVCANESFVAIVPFWAVWPFETLVVANRHTPDLGELTGAERSGLADLLKRLTTRYDNLFATAFPYTMGFHQRPTDGAPYPEFHLHAHYYPPLLRSASVRKFMVGFEMLAGPQRDITPEAAAERLRAMEDS
jgi:UDPglucose--hexose-1-phosphate uridylyltransferase